MAATAALAATVSGHAASAARFDIVYAPPEGTSASQLALLDEAERFWESLVIGYQFAVPFESLTIEIGAFEEGPGGVLAEANTLRVDASGPFILPYQSYIDFDIADLPALEASGSALGVLLHETAHAMGFGTLWQLNRVYQDGSGAYEGAAGIAAYRREFDPLAEIVPVELDGGPGTADAHWDETWAGGRNALMTGFFDEPVFLSETTLRSFRDLGYVTVPVPASMWLGLGAFGLLGWVARRRTG